MTHINGNIFLHRKMRDWEWYKVPNTKDVFIELLFIARWRDQKYKGEIVPRGSVITSLDEIGAATGLTKDEVRTALKHLKSSHDISHTKKHNKLLIKVHNYDIYQNNSEDDSVEVPTPFPIQFPHDSHTIPTHPIEEQREQREEGITPIVPYGEIKKLYQEICISYPKVTAMSDARKKAIAARFKSGYSQEDFRVLFSKAEKSSFLKGANDRNWSATFDWLIKDANMAKVLDGNYDNKPKQEANNGNAPKLNTMRI